MNLHNMDRYVRDGFEYKSRINRLVIKQTSANTYDLMLKHKFILDYPYPSFAHVQIEAIDGVPVSSTFHYHYVVYFVFAMMHIILFFMFLSQWGLGSVLIIVQAILIVFLKIQGYKELEKINARILNGEPIQSI